MAISLPWSDAAAARAPRVDAGLATRAVRLAAPHVGVIIALSFTLAVHVPSLGYYFDGDDFVVLGSVEYLGARRYIVDSWLMRDIVASWRPLTSMIYAAEWEVFGLHPLGWRIVNLTVHLGSVALLYALVLRTTRRAAPSAIAALVFGVSGAHFDTVNYITALPHVLSTFFVLSSLLSMVTYCSRTLSHRTAVDAKRGSRPPAAARSARTLYWLSFGFFILAFLSNEGAFIYAPLIVLAYALYASAWRRPVALVLHAVPFALVASSWLAFYQSCACDQLKIEEYGWGPHVLRNYGVYLSWIAAPARETPLSPDATRWAIAGAVAALCGWFALRGPHIARIGAAGMVLALLPFVPVEIWTASRYTYGAVALVAPVAAVGACAVFDRARAVTPRARAPVTVAALLLVATIAALNAWQTHAQHQRSGASGERWRLLARELRVNYADVPDGTTIYIVGGPWQNPMENYAWVPSVARALYGDAAAFNIAPGADEPDPADHGHEVFLEWRDRGLHPPYGAPAEISAGGRASGR